MNTVPDVLDAAHPPALSRRARYGWPVGIALVLFLSAASNIAVMFIARSDAAFAVEPDYYAKAVNWDGTMAQERANAALGWRAVATLDLATPGTPGTITVRLTDRSGVALAGATVGVEAMHNARASQRYAAALTERSPGHYTAALDAHRPGAWEVRVSAARESMRFTAALRLDAH
jgi:nitrogen fixation protein FixH